MEGKFVQHCTLFCRDMNLNVCPGVCLSVCPVSVLAGAGSGGPEHHRLPAHGLLLLLGLLHPGQSPPARQLLLEPRDQWYVERPGVNPYQLPTARTRHLQLAGR